MEWTNIYLAFGLTLFAGLATAIGGGIAFFAKRTNTTFLSYSLGFSAGVMIYISFTEILGEANIIIGRQYTENASAWLTFIFFIVGVFLTALIDKMVPSRENPHEMRSLEQMDNGRPCRGKKLLRVGIITAVAIAIHNFPEGIATFMAGVSDITVGISIAIAIAIHNIPEGIAVSVPVYYATGSRKKAFWWAALSGLSEPLGAFFGYFILSFFHNQIILGYVFAVVAGIMIYISFDELLPAAHQYGKHHTTIYGLISGIIVIGISLMLL
ncbi:MAG TPA: zinc transporter ZupT [Bacteroidetes bacterium]|nr:zinc transporter ZupT [Bacteroidota bacterium]